MKTLSGNAQQQNHDQSVLLGDKCPFLTCPVHLLILLVIVQFFTPVTFVSSSLLSICCCSLWTPTRCLHYVVFHLNVYNFFFLVFIPMLLLCESFVYLTYHAKNLASVHFANLMETEFEKFPPFLHVYTSLVKPLPMWRFLWFLLIFGVTVYSLLFLLHWSLPPPKSQKSPSTVISLEPLCPVWFPFLQNSFTELHTNKMFWRSHPKRKLCPCGLYINSVNKPTNVKKEKKTFCAKVVGRSNVGSGFLSGTKKPRMHQKIDTIGELVSNHPGDAARDSRTGKTTSFEGHWTALHSTVWTFRWGRKICLVCQIRHQYKWAGQPTFSYLMIWHLFAIQVNQKWRKFFVSCLGVSCWQPFQKVKRLSPFSFSYVSIKIVNPFVDSSHGNAAARFLRVFTNPCNFWTKWSRHPQYYGDSICVFRGRSSRSRTSILSAVLWRLW